jgi:8-oxo-dGTP pyrophosphatase MutT (NUDIX family)
VTAAEGIPLTAAVLVLDTCGRWLILRHRDRWQLPGGLVKPGESPRQAAAREVREETGLTVAPGGLLVADWCAPDGPRRRGRFALVFSTAPVPDQAPVVLQDDEADEYQWAPPGLAVQQLHPLITARLAGCLTQPGTVYLETLIPRSHP